SPTDLRDHASIRASPTIDRWGSPKDPMALFTSRTISAGGSGESLTPDGSSQTHLETLVHELIRNRTRIALDCHEILVFVAPHSRTHLVTLAISRVIRVPLDRVEYVVLETHDYASVHPVASGPGVQEQRSWRHAASIARNGASHKAAVLLRRGCEQIAGHGRSDWQRTTDGIARLLENECREARAPRPLG